MVDGVRFGLVIPQLVPWPMLVERFRFAEDRGFDSAWMGIAVHSAQTVFFIFAALGLVLGLA